MIDLGVATREETFERMVEPLEERDISVRPIQASERVISLQDEEAFPSIDVGFVFPPRIMEGSVLDRKLSVPWINDLADVLASRNKAGTLVTLSKAGLPVPDTTVVSNPVETDALEAVFERFESPVVVKPNSTTRGVGIAKVGDLDSFLGLCDYLELVHDYRATGDKAFLVQEFLPGARDVRVMTIDGAYAGAVERRLSDTSRAEGRWKHNVHRGGEAVSIDLAEELRNLAERAAAALEIDWLGVDLLVSDEQVVVTETNARPTIDAASKYEPDFYDRLATLVKNRYEVD